MNILITGASSGFGRLTVEKLVAAGHRVVGTVRDPAGRNAEAAARLHELGADTVDIDVTDEASVAAGVEAATASLGTIDVLINNAGIGVHGLQENFSADELHRVFDINVYGVHRMARAVLPAMRARRSGLILNISSLLGRVTLPFYGPYNASKWAVEALSENYRTELSQFGVDVALIEPGGFPTTFFDNVLHPGSTDRDAGYGDLAHAPQAAFEGFAAFLDANPQQAPGLVADAVLQVIDAAPGTRPFRTEVDRIGMGDPIQAYNAHHAEVTHGIFASLGMDGMLQLQQSPKAEAAAAG
ncbi:MAG: SDR family oxidoreductase [Pseudomonadota bacterium]